MFLSTENLEKLKCSNCNRLLSVFPVYVTINEDNQSASICGRCQIPTNGKYARVEFYEALAKTLRFPCTNRASGCMEDLLPVDVQQHESQCCYRKTNCLIDNENKCNFVGQYRNWLDHCATKHADLIDKNHEIHINESQESHSLLKYKGEVFLAKLTFEHNSKWLRCSINNLGFSSDKTRIYHIKINLATMDAVIMAKFPPIIASDIDPKSVNVNVESLIKDSNIVDCSFRICDNNNDNDGDELNQQILGNLNCSSCAELLLPPTYHCLHGHAGCYKCKDKPCKKCHSSTVPVPKADFSFSFVGLSTTTTSSNLASNNATISSTTITSPACTTLITTPTTTISGNCTNGDKLKFVNPLTTQTTTTTTHSSSNVFGASNPKIFGINATTKAPQSGTIFGTCTTTLGNSNTCRTLGNNTPIFGSNATISSTTITSPACTTLITTPTTTVVWHGNKMMFVNPWKTQTTSSTTTASTSNVFGMSPNRAINPKSTNNSGTMGTTGVSDARHQVVLKPPRLEVVSTTTSTTTNCSTSNSTNNVGFSFEPSSASKTELFGILNIRNTTLDSIIELINYHCKFMNHGCMYIAKPYLIRNHQQYCLYNYHNCPLKDFVHCLETIYQKNIPQHIFEKHNDIIMITDSKSISIDAKKMISDLSVITYSNYLFKMIFQFNDKKFYWIMQLINPTEDVNNFKFEIDIMQNCNHDRRILIRERCTALRSIDECINTSSCVSLTLKQIKDYLIDNVLTFKVRILQ